MHFLEHRLGQCLGDLQISDASAHFLSFSSHLIEDPFAPVHRVYAFFDGLSQFVHMTVHRVEDHEYLATRSLRRCGRFGGRLGHLCCCFLRRRILCLRRLCFFGGGLNLNRVF